MHVVARHQPMRNPLQIAVKIDVLCEVALEVDGVARVSSLFFCHGHMDVRLFIYAFILPPFCRAFFILCRP